MAKYFVYIEVYDFSVSEDEQVKMTDGSKTTQTTRLGLRALSSEQCTVYI